MKTMNIRGSIHDNAQIKSSTSLSQLLNFVFISKLLSVTACCAQLGRLCENFHVANLKHIMMREHIMMFVAEQLPRFRLKHSTCKTYSISRISGRGP